MALAVVVGFGCLVSLPPVHPAGGGLSWAPSPGPTEAGVQATSAAWYCVGPPDSKERLILGDNGSRPLSANVSVSGTSGPLGSATVNVPAGHTAVVELGSLGGTGAGAATVVTKGPGAVWLAGPDGSGVVACSRAVASEWYQAGGSTAQGHDFDLLIYDPMPEDAVVNVILGTPGGSQVIADYQGLVVKSKHLLVIDLGLRALDIPLLAASVQAVVGEVVSAGWALQGHFASLITALPDASTHWVLPLQLANQAIQSADLIYNPSDASVHVSLELLLGEGRRYRQAMVFGPGEVKELVAPGLPGISIGVARISSRGGPVVVESVLRVGGVGLERGAVTGGMVGSGAGRWVLPPTDAWGSNASLYLSATGSARGSLIVGNWLSDLARLRGNLLDGGPTSIFIRRDPLGAELSSSVKFVVGGMAVGGIATGLVPAVAVP